MPEQQDIAGAACEGLVARGASRGLRTEGAVAVDGDVFGQNSDAEAPAIVGAESGPVIGIR